MLNIFFVILVDLIGFGIMIPIFAYYVLHLGGGAEAATLLMSLYMVGMFVSAPILGRLSDKFGRKPILMLSMFGASIGYFMLAFADSLLMVAIARLLSGFMAGNIAAAQAYITDITDKSNRAKGMGLLGAAFGLGFVIGPAIGSYMAGNDFATANFFYPAITSAALSILSCLAILLFLKESLTEENKQKLAIQPKQSPWQAMKSVMSRKVLSLLVLCGVLFNLAAGLFESIFPLWAKDLQLVDGPQGLVPFMLAAGLTLVIIQGGLVGKLTKKYSEQVVLKYSIWLYAIAMLLLIWTASLGSYYGVLAAMCAQAAGTGLVLTCVQSLVSMRAKPHERGTVMGTFSSFGTLSRAIATMATGAIYTGIGFHSPLIIAAACILGIFFLILIISNTTE